MTGIDDFFRMAKARGVGRVLRHLRDVTLYDLCHGTDSDTWPPLSAYTERPENFAETVQYQPSWRARSCGRSREPESSWTSPPLPSSTSARASLALETEAV
ncbi:MAG TPA: hypothetical protein VMM55_04510 [Thermohalobaculum sp.]|nr:hypothetical protein [Thermohalobaculum sp.]